MNKKRKLILHFALDCLFIVLYLLTMVMHLVEFGSLVCLCFALTLATNYFHSRKRIGYILWSYWSWSRFRSARQRERELTTAEVIAVFAIAISGFYILVFTKVASLLHSIAFIIPMGIIVLAIRLLYFSKELVALQTPKPASN